MNRVQKELDQFKFYKKSLAKLFKVQDLDEYGFSVTNGSSNKFDLLVTGIVHGDELVGLETINRVLKKLETFKTNLHLGFLLCNIPAALKGVRFIETDLNRSFLLDDHKTLEHHRAKQISAIAKNAKFVIDMHQTHEATESAFFILAHSTPIIRAARVLDQSLPIVTFPLMGFSQSGKTLTEFATKNNILAITIEWGEMGFSEAQSSRAENFIFNTIQRLEKSGLSFSSSEKLDVYYLKEYVKNTPGAKLAPGLVSYRAIKKGQVIGHSDAGPILSPYDGRLFFPKYGELANRSTELCELGELTTCDLSEV